MTHHHTSEPTLPRALPLLAGMTTGLAAGCAVSVLLGARGMSVASLWAHLTSGAPLQFASASVLWAIAGTAFVVGAATAALIVKYPPPWHDFRTARWVLGALVVFALAHVAHGVEPPDDVGPGTIVLANMSAIVVAAIMALIGAFFARQR